jgi:hypothetical protein
MIEVFRPDPRKGAVVRRHEPRIGMRWTRAAPSRMRAQGGQRIEPTPVSGAQAAFDERR